MARRPQTQEVDPETNGHHGLFETTHPAAPVPVAPSPRTRSIPPRFGWMRTTRPVSG